MIREYLQAAMKRAQYEVLEDDGTHYGEIPGFGACTPMRLTWRSAHGCWRKCWRSGYSCGSLEDSRSP